MKNKLTNIGIMLCMVITLTLTSCSCSQPGRNVYIQPGEVSSYQPTRQGHHPRTTVDDAHQRRIDGAKGFIRLTGTEKLSPIDPTPEVYKGIISGKRFIRSGDGIISEAVLRTIANGGVIGWSGSDFGFEPTVQELTGVTDRLSVDDVAKACVKYRKFPSPQSRSGQLVRARAIQIERQRGYTMR